MRAVGCTRLAGYVISHGFSGAGDASSAIYRKVQTLGGDVEELAVIIVETNKIS